MLKKEEEKRRMVNVRQWMEKEEDKANRIKKTERKKIGKQSEKRKNTVTMKREEEKGRKNKIRNT